MQFGRLGLFVLDLRVAGMKQIDDPSLLRQIGRQVNLQLTQTGRTDVDLLDGACRNRPDALTNQQMYQLLDEILRE